MWRVAIGQISGKANWRSNYEVCSRLVAVACDNGAKALFLPEASDWISPSNEQKADYSCLCVDSQLFLDGISGLAAKFKIDIFAGIHEKSVVDGKFYNSQIAIDSNGNVIARYHKIHLFDYPTANLMESNRTMGGEELSQPFSVFDGLTCGMAVCYDLRFPELSLGLIAGGANVLTYPSAFTVPTGRAHWEILLRSRAIECQSFVIAAAQVGQHEDGRKSWGESMIVDPQGQIVVKCSSIESSASNIGQVYTDDDFEIGFADLDPILVSEIRSKMPLSYHRSIRKWNPDWK